MEQTSFWDLVSSGAMIIAPPLPFLAQYVQMVRTKSSKGFSRAGPIILLISNALRLAFWFGKRYSLVLVVQSLALIAVQLMLLHKSVSLKNAATKKFSSQTLPIYNEEEQQQYNEEEQQYNEEEHQYSGGEEGQGRRREG